MAFEASLVVEIDETKKVWLDNFKDPVVAERDVVTLSSSAEAPKTLLSFAFVFVCKDWSLLNSASSDFRDGCLTSEREADGRGLAGKTWAGCMRYVAEVLPLLLWIENVYQALRGTNWERLTQDLHSSGYVVSGVPLALQGSECHKTGIGLTS